MAESWKGKLSLSTLPWRVLSLGAGAEGGYLVKGCFHQESGYHVMLMESLTAGIWEERLDVGQIMQRLKVFCAFMLKAVQKS